MAANLKETMKVMKPWGPFIYEDDEGRILYYDVFTKKGFFIPKNKRETYNYYNLRIPGAFVVFCIIVLYFHNYTLAFAGAVATYLIIYLLFRYLFLLKKLPFSATFVREKRVSFMENGVANYSYSRIIAVLILCPLCIGFIVLMITTVDLRNNGLYFYYFLILLLTAFEIMMAVMMIKKRKRKR